jgi:hypothetical protein
MFNLRKYKISAKLGAWNTLQVLLGEYNFIPICSVWRLLYMEHKLGVCDYIKKRVDHKTFLGYMT